METQGSDGARQASPKQSKKWVFYAAGFGAGFAIVLVLMVSALVRYNPRPKPQKPWNTNAIKVKFTDLTTQLRDAEVHIVFRYALTNTTEVDYLIPNGTDGVLMKGVPDGGLQKFENATWDAHLVIPARKTVNVEFDTSVDPS